MADLSPDILERLDTEGFYRTHLERQQLEFMAFKQSENIALTEDLDYNAIPGLSYEVKQALSYARPSSLVRQ